MNHRRSRDQVFVILERIHRRAMRLLNGGETPADEASVDDAVKAALGRAAGVELRLPLVAKAFGLPPLAVDLLVCLVAAEYDPYLRLLQRAVQRDAGRPWLELGTIAELLGLSAAEVPELARLLARGQALRHWALVLVDDGPGEENPAVSTRVKIAERVAQFVVGVDALPDWMRRVDPEPAGGCSLMPGELQEAVLRRVRLALRSGQTLTVEISGPPGCGKRTFARRLAGQLSVPLLIVDLAGVERAELEQVLGATRREARLQGAMVCLADWDAHLPASASHADDSSAPPPRARALPPVYTRFFAALEGTVLLTAKEREPLLEALGARLVHADVPFPSHRQRAVLLEAAVRRQGEVAPEVDFPSLGRRFALDPARIETAAAVARDLAAQGDGAVTSGQLTEACRRQLRHDLDSIAVRVSRPYAWDDLVVEADVIETLREMIAYVRHADRVYDQWGFGARHGLMQGVSALFSGPPGTGKTMCATVMARELEMELFRVDVSRIVSKWIGETEKNLAHVFNEAERSNGIILFDEADSLFSKRTDVKSSVDRHSNQELNFLLQRMETFTGVSILTTNLEDSIDAAFKRRLTFRLRFEKPDAGQRARLWRNMFPSTCLLAPDVDWDMLGRGYELSGGSIRNAAVRAAFHAASAGKTVDMAACCISAERECLEMGHVVRSQPSNGHGKDHFNQTAWS